MLSECLYLRWTSHPLTSWLMYMEGLQRGLQTCHLEGSSVGHNLFIFPSDLVWEYFFTLLCKKKKNVFSSAFWGDLPLSHALDLPKCPLQVRVLLFPGFCLGVCLHLNFFLFCQQRGRPCQREAEANCPPVLSPLCSHFPPLLIGLSCHFST